MRVGFGGALSCAGGESTVIIGAYNVVLPAMACRSAVLFSSPFAAPAKTSVLPRRKMVNNNARR